MNRMLFTEFRQWEYEDEIRVPVRLDPATETEAGLYFIDFGDSLRLAQVIVGMRSATCRREVDAALGGSEGVEIIRAEAAHDRFAVVPAGTSSATTMTSSITWFAAVCSTRLSSFAIPSRSARERDTSALSGFQGSEMTSANRFLAASPEIAPTRPSPNSPPFRQGVS